ncbi:Myosin-binding protein 3 [Camellia lanceoleosa]|uniref:Myosin-binding protein 3 n=1 Tax=Camellia lanceoleosa TaxID=1840588 RepID=A0ACC0HIU5_9ERIC|nr:Myosin-binding protein 3 [Camellia lanceoleosa]
MRSQDEKASIEMKAWQYQRRIEEKSAYDAEEMNILKEILVRRIEEKSAYDAEEMNILKEILVRRQKEKHFLEREVEAYRRMIHIGN